MLKVSLSYNVRAYCVTAFSFPTKGIINCSMKNKNNKTKR